MDTPITRAELQSARKTWHIEFMLSKARALVIDVAREGTDTKTSFRPASHVQEILENVRKTFPDCKVTEDDGVILVDWS